MTARPDRRPAPSGGRLAEAAAGLLVRMRWFVIVFWLLVCVASTFFLPGLGETQSSGSLKGLLPPDTPAITTELRSVEIFGFPLTGRTVVVQRDPDGLSVFDQGRTVVNAAGVDSRRTARLGPLRGALPISNGLGLFPSSSERNTTALTFLLYEPDVSFGAQTRSARRYAERHFGRRDSVVGITGSVPARSEQAGIIHDSLPLAELLTLSAIVLIVGFAFRSVIAPVVAVLTAGVCYVVTLQFSGAVAALIGVSSPSELEPVIVALLLGVVTDYVVFYLTALRHELAGGAGRLEAAHRATARYGPIVGVAGMAVAAGTAALLVAESLFFRALGPALIFTVLMSLLVSLTLVPALMAVLGRWAFWPTQPARRRRAPRRTPSPYGGLLTAITRSRKVAALIVIGGVAGLSLAALPLSGLNLGVSFVGSLPPDNGVREAATAARSGFAAGILSPTTVLVEGSGVGDQRGDLATLGNLLGREPGVAGVIGPGDLPGDVERRVFTSKDGAAARFLVVLDDPALGADAIDSVAALDQRLPDLLTASGLSDASAGLAGDTPASAFIVDQTSGDLLRIAIAALGANFLLLVIFLRAVVAALYLLIGSVLSLAASLGLTTLVFGHLDPGAGLTFYVPFAAAVLLLAFGSDYNIFSVGNIWDAVRSRPLAAAIIETMPTTIAAILAAGLALAASFGLLAVVPLAAFRELAFVMFVGIMIDVLVVRALLMPALLALFGPISAWPSERLASR